MYGIVTEGGTMHSDRVAKVSSGRSSRASDEGQQQGAASRTQDSMSDKRQKNQLELAFTEESRSEAPKTPWKGTESLTAKCETERPADHEQLMEEVCERKTAGRLTSESKGTREVRESTA
jgi:hypothetical protein